VAVFARIWPVSVRVRGWVSFTTGTVRSAILATAGLLVTTRRYVSAVFAAVVVCLRVRLSVQLSVRLSHAGIVSKRLSVESTQNLTSYSCSATPISYKDDEISRLSRLVFEI